MKAQLFAAALAVLFSASARADVACGTKHSALYLKCTNVRQAVEDEYRASTGKDLSPSTENSDLYEAQWDVFGDCSEVVQKLNAIQLLQLEELNKSCVNEEGRPVKTLGEQNWCALENMKTVLESQCELPL